MHQINLMTERNPFLQWCFGGNVQNIPVARIYSNGFKLKKGHN